MSGDYSRPARDDVRDHRRSVERAWERRERLDALDDRWVREGEAEPEPERREKGDDEKPGVSEDE